MDLNLRLPIVREMDWPSEGITYSYEQRGYIQPEKVNLWLTKAFGPNKASYEVSVNIIRLCLPTFSESIILLCFSGDPKNES